MNETSVPGTNTRCEWREQTANEKSDPALCLCFPETSNHIQTCGSWQIRPLRFDRSGAAWRSFSHIKVGGFWWGEQQEEPLLSGIAVICRYVADVSTAGLVNVQHALCPNKHTAQSCFRRQFLRLQTCQRLSFCCHFLSVCCQSCLSAPVWCV